ncbi:tape measure protein [Rhodopirellula sp. P2]|uniref:tape measure protein n=1 Tax=Rhodopirellula sp. P2 TaxID=2127060 RepID=UPI002367BAE2|nr:tape measure protein [Rhodopirellula sp. P2]WDQ16387.1 tape measure protein [Rhodopirellula sp. P2]
MAFELAEAYVQLSTRGFSTVTGKMNQVRSGLGSLVRVGAGATAGIAAGVAGVAGAFAGLAAVSVPVAARLEQTETQFKTLLGSADAAKKKMEELQDFAASTPFQFDGLADAAKMLLAFGTSSEQVVPVLKTLGDVAAATGNDIGELAGIYGKVQSRGALMTESLDQFNERGIPLGRKLAEMMGKTGEEIRAMASKGQISFADMQRAMRSMTAEGGMAFDGMASQAGTLTGVWSTFKDNVSILMGDIGGAIAEGFDMKGVTANMTGFVQRVRSEWLPSIVERFQWVSQNIVGPVMSATGEIANTFFELVSDIDLHWRQTVNIVAGAMLDSYQHVKTFFTNAVTLGGWWLDGTTQIFQNLTENGSAIFGSLIEILKAQWNIAIDHMSGRTPNPKAYADAITNYAKIANDLLGGVKLELPELETAQLGGMQGEIDRVNEQLHQRQMQRLDARNQREKEARNQEVAGLEIDDKAKAGKEQYVVDESTEVEEKTTKLAKDRVGYEKQVTAEKQRQAGGMSDLAGLATQNQQAVLSGGRSSTEANDKLHAIAGNLAASRKAAGPREFGGVDQKQWGRMMDRVNGREPAEVQPMGQMQIGAGAVADAAMAKVAVAAERQAATLDRIYAAATGGGLRVKQVAGSSGPSVDPKQIAFGMRG